MEAAYASLSPLSPANHHVSVSQVYHRLQYFVPMPGKKMKDQSGKRQRLELLKGISGATVPGQLTALIGGSGAGKVTLHMAPEISIRRPFHWCPANSHADIAT